MYCLDVGAWVGCSTVKGTRDKRIMKSTFECGLNNALLDCRNDKNLLFDCCMTYILIGARKWLAGTKGQDINGWVFKISEIHSTAFCLLPTCPAEGRSLPCPPCLSLPPLPLVHVYMYCSEGVPPVYVSWRGGIGMLGHRWPK